MKRSWSEYCRKPRPPAQINIDRFLANKVLVKQQLDGKHVHQWGGKGKKQQKKKGLVLA
jgi:hypothetical protein